MQIIGEFFSFKNSSEIQKKHDSSIGNFGLAQIKEYNNEVELNQYKTKIVELQRELQSIRFLTKDYASSEDMITNLNETFEDIKEFKNQLETILFLKDEKKEKETSQELSEASNEILFEFIKAEDIYSLKKMRKFVNLMKYLGNFILDKKVLIEDKNELVHSLVELTHKALQNIFEVFCNTCLNLLINQEYLDNITLDQADQNLRELHFEMRENVKECQAFLALFEHCKNNWNPSTIYWFENIWFNCESFKFSKSLKKQVEFYQGSAFFENYLEQIVLFRLKMHIGRIEFPVRTIADN